MMERLYTPWRLSYVTDASAMTPSCIFCEALAGVDRDPMVIHHGPLAFVILNKYPYNNGHVMVVPNRHVGRLADLRPEEANELMALAQHVEQALTHVYQPHGF